MNNEVVRHEPGLMELVQQIINSPNAKDQVEVVKAMLDLKERLEDRAATQAFAQAMHDLQSRILPITKDGEIRVKGVVRSRYAKFDTIDDVVRPLMDEYGFSFGMTETGIEDTFRVFAGTVLHAMGHADTKTIRLPLDKSDFRSAGQSEAATLSYARRELYIMHFNIVQRDQENLENVEPISDDQAKDLNTKIQDTKSSLKAFCQYFGIAKLEELKKVDLSRAIELLDKKAELRKETAKKEAKEAEQREPGQL